MLFTSFFSHGRTTVTAEDGDLVLREDGQTLRLHLDDTDLRALADTATREALRRQKPNLAAVPDR